MEHLSILVVDGDPLVRWSVAETLVAGGHRVVEGADARSAWCAVRDASRAFDVALLDLRLTDSEDLLLVASIRALSPTTRVIVMTEFGTPDAVQGALDFGTFKVIGKPFDMGALPLIVADARPN